MNNQDSLTKSYELMEKAMEKAWDMWKMGLTSFTSVQEQIENLTKQQFEQNKSARGKLIEMEDERQKLMTSSQEQLRQMVEEAVEDCRGERAVIVENLWPVFEGPIGSDDDRASLIALRDDLEEKIGPMLVDGQIAQFIEEEHGRRQVFLELGFEAIGGLSGGQ